MNSHGTQIKKSACEETLSPGIDQSHGFCGFSPMYLTAPTIDELRESELPDLVDMLSRQAAEYSRVIKSEGTTSKAIAVKELIVNIQTVIEAKKKYEKRVTAK